MDAEQQQAAQGRGFVPRVRVVEAQGTMWGDYQFTWSPQQRLAARRAARASVPEAGTRGQGVGRAGPPEASLLGIVSPRPHTVVPVPVWVLTSHEAAEGTRARLRGPLYLSHLFGGLPPDVVPS